MKFINAISDKFTTTRQAAGVEVIADAEGITFHLVLLAKKGNTVRVEKQETKITAVDMLRKHIPGGTPVYLAINGKGILHKKINASSAADPQTLLTKVLPNAVPHEFYVQHTAADSGLLVSVVRRQQLEELLETLKPLPVISCTLGSLSVAALAPLLGNDNYRYDIITATQRISVSDNQLQEVVNEIVPAENYTIGDEKINAANITAYAVALAHFTGSGIKADAAVLKTAAAEFRQQRIFKTGGGAILVFVLLVLLGNYFAFQHFWEKKNTLETQLALNGGELQRYQVLEKSITEKQQFLQSSGLLYASRTAFYADQLAAGVPEGISLTRLNISPRRQLNTSDTIAFTPAAIHIEGLCEQSFELNNWISKLKELNWVKHVSLQTYNQDSRKEQGAFTIAVGLQ